MSNCWKGKNEFIKLATIEMSFFIWKNVINEIIGCKSNGPRWG